MRIRNIALIGMPGVGKSTIGVVLAKNLGMSFIDSDLVIQEQEGKRLCELIEEHGFDGFLEIEGRQVEVLFTARKQCGICVKSR